MLRVGAYANGRSHLGQKLLAADARDEARPARVEMETVTVRQSSAAVGRSLNDMNALCGGARVAALIRGGQVRYDLDATSFLAAGDTVVLIGPAESLAAAIKVFSQDAAAAAGETAAIGD